MASDLRYFEPLNTDFDDVNPDSLEYMDYMGCAGSDDLKRCYAWQPNYELSWNGYGVGDGYPRFGANEEGITAAFISKTNRRAIEFEDVVLQSALTLAAGCTVGILSLF